MKNIFFTVLWLSPVLNIALYTYRKWVDKHRKDGKFFDVGVQIHKVVISGPKNWVWFRYFFEDLLLKAVLAAIPAMILKDFPLFLILLSIGFVALILKIGITLFPFPWPVFFFLANRGTWTFYCFTFYYIRGFGVFLLGALAAAAILIGAVDLLETEPVLLSEPTVVAHFFDKNNIGRIPAWVGYAVIIPFVAVMVANIFYLWFKITPLLTRFNMEYDRGVLRLMSRMSKKEIARIDFEKPYAYEQAVDERSVYHDYTTHIFAQNNKAIAITEGLYGSFKKGFPVRWRRNVGLGFPIWESKLSDTVRLTYVVTPEECEEFFGEIIKNRKKG